MNKVPLVEFVIRLSDMRKAAKQLSLNREEFGETDCADLLVSSFAATFRSVGTATEVPANGKHPGSVRLPLKLLPKLLEVAKTYRKPELTWQFEEGTMRVEKFSWTHPDIRIGTLPDPKFDLPVNAGLLQTLAMASLLSPEEIADQGLRERVETAQKRVSQAVSFAAGTLQQFEVSSRQIQELVDLSIQRNAESLRRMTGR